MYPKGELLKVCIQDQKIVVNQIDASASTFNLVTAFERNIKDLVLNYTPLFEVNENQICNFFLFFFGFCIFDSLFI